MYWIINTKKKTYKQVEREDESFDGNWKENYSHTKGAEWHDVYAASLWEYDKTSNGIYFEYDLCCEGGMFRLYVDKDEHSSEEIEKAKREVRGDRDVVSLRAVILKKA